MPIKTNISLVAFTLSALLVLPSYAVPSLNDSHNVTSKSIAAQSESEKANALFETIFMENIMASPIAQTYMGIKQDYDKWDDIGDEADARELARTKKQLAEVNQLDASKLDPKLA